MRFFLGDHTADLLDIPKAAWEDRFVKAALQAPVFPKLMALQKPTTSSVLERYLR